MDFVDFVNFDFLKNPPIARSVWGWNPEEQTSWVRQSYQQFFRHIHAYNVRPLTAFVTLYTISFTRLSALGAYW